MRGHGCLDWEALEVFHAGRSLVSGFLLFQLTTTGVLAREQARRKSRRFNEYDNYGPDGPEFPGF